MFKIYISIFLSLLPLSKSSQIKITKIDRLFPQTSVLHLMGYFYNLDHPFWKTKLFKYLLQNSKFPKLVHDLQGNYIEYNPSYRNCRYNEYTYPKYYGHYTTQIFILFLPKIETFLERDLVQKFGYQFYKCGQNPAYIFFVLAFRRFETDRKSELSSSLFVIYQPAKPVTEFVHIFVICHTCSHQLVEVPVTHIRDTGSLYAYWKLQNSNLHRFEVDSDGKMNFDPNKETCSAIQRGENVFPQRFICAQLALGGKLNFTDVIISGIQYPPDLKYSEHRIGYHLAVTKGTIYDVFVNPLSTHYSWLPNCPQSYQFKLAAVSFKRSKVDGILAVTLPLDVPTWAASAVSLLLISVLLAGIGFNKSGSLIDFKSNFLQCTYWILSCLFGQFHGTPAIIKLMGVYSAIFVVLWVLMFFLMGTVFYQGAIFSSLVTVQSPNLPSTLQSVVDSQIQIITTTPYYSNLNGYGSMFKALFLEDEINAAQTGTKHFRTLTDLKMRTKFIERASPFTLGLRISDSLPVKFDSGEVTSVMDTFAIINLEHDLVQILAGIKLKGDPQVVRSLEPSISIMHNPICVLGKIFLPQISQGFGQLAQSGLFQLWGDLDDGKELVSNVKKFTSEDLSRQVILTHLFGIRRKIVHEDAEPVSISALDGFLLLVVGLFAVALVIFLSESVTYEKLRYLGFKFRHGVAKVVGKVRG